MINHAYNELYGLLVGKFYTKADLAFVGKSRAMPRMFMNAVNQTITGVSFPALAKLQDDKAKFRDAMRRMIQCSTFLVFPLLTVLAVTARPLVLLLYGNQWEPAIVYVPVGCFALAMGPITSINCIAISAMGKSGIYLILEIVKKSSGLVLMLLSIRHGVMAFVATMAFVQGPFAILANTFVNGRLLDYSFGKQMRDIAPAAGLCAVSAAAMWGAGLALSPLVAAIPVRNLAYAATLAVECSVGFGTYLALAYAFRLRPLSEYCNILLPVLRKRFPALAGRISPPMWMQTGNA